MPKGRRRKTDDEFFDESMEFFIQNGTDLKNIYPEIVNEYNDHSLLKLISMTYWVGIFSPIAHRQLRQRHGYEIVYVDTMAGSGVTKTKREGDYFCGSCTGAVLSARKIGFPFDRVIAVEIDPNNARALERRLKYIDPNVELLMHNEDISQVSDLIVKEVELGCVSYMVIDPEGFEGMTWKSIGPLLTCKGDAMMTWFEMDAWRMRGVALSRSRNANTIGERLTELVGSEEWKDVSQPSDLTDVLVRRILRETKKEAAECIDIEDRRGKHYKMILFAGKFQNSQKLTMEWKRNMEKRLGSSSGRNIEKLLDRKTGRVRDLRDFMSNNQEEV